MTSEASLLPADLKNIHQTVYRSRRKMLPKLPKNRQELHECLNDFEIKTCKGELFLLANDTENEMVIFTCKQNLETLCSPTLDGILIDGTFKNCPTFFMQLYTIHGTVNGHYMPLVYCLLPNKTQDTYRRMWTIITDACTEINLDIQCRIFHVDFEKSVHNVVKELFPGASVKGCQFHLGQAMWRKIQELGLSKIYSERDCDTAKWLSHTFGLAYLDPQEVEDSFVFDLMPDTPSEDAACERYADYLLSTYVSSDSKFPPELWTSKPEVEKNEQRCKGIS